MAFSRRGGGGGREQGERRAPAPLDAARLEQLALAYVARFATSGGKLGDYLGRKLRERGWESEDGEGDAGGVVEALVARFVGAGYVDDAGFAQARSSSLQRRGYGQRRIAQALGDAGIDAQTARAALPGVSAARAAALAMARKRRFGPYGTGGDGAGGDWQAARARREKQVAAMLRAGHALDSARELVNAISIEAAERWAAEADDEV